MGQEQSTATAWQRPYRRLLWLTWLGLWAERLALAFWPAWSASLTLAALWLFGTLPPGAPLWAGLALIVALTLWGLWRLRPPTGAEAWARMDAALPGQPLAALGDALALGQDNPLTAALWAAHRARMEKAAKAARAIAPDLRLSAADSLGLRYMALLLFIMAAGFGPKSAALGLSPLGPGVAVAAPAATWEGWVRPPAYTGAPVLYLADQAEGELTLLQGSEVLVRFYGAPGLLAVEEGVSQAGAAPVPPAAAAAGPEEIRLVVAQSGPLAISGPGGRSWAVVMRPDEPPSFSLTGELKRAKGGAFTLPYKAEDDYGIVKAGAEITLDQPALDRRYGLAAPPDDTPPLTLPIALPQAGGRKALEGEWRENLSPHLYANLPVTLRLWAEDGAGQRGESATLQAILPGRRFFDPLAASLIELRRDLLWAAANAGRTDALLRALIHRPEGPAFRNGAALARLNALVKTGAKAETAARAEELWQIALLVEEGDLKDAAARLARAQDRLDEAIRRGADPAEVAELMEELREATDAYLDALAAQERDPSSPEEQSVENQGQSSVTDDQIAQMMDELQKLMEEGRMAEAQALSDALRELMQNLEMTEGGEGEGGRRRPGDGQMRDMQDALRDQQSLADEAFRNMQEGPPGGMDVPAQPAPGEGQSFSDAPDGTDPRGRGQNGAGEAPSEGEGGAGGENDQAPSGGESLAERQEALRERIEDLSERPLPGPGSAPGETAREALKGAAEAMERAEEALREGNLPGALDRQAQAMEALREGIGALAELQNQGEREAPGQAAEGPDSGTQTPSEGRDPLGRERGNAARIGSDRNLLADGGGARRAEALLNELRRRAGELARPLQERDYLRRLLQQF